MQPPWTIDHYFGKKLQARLYYYQVWFLCYGYFVVILGNFD